MNQPFVYSVLISIQPSEDLSEVGEGIYETPPSNYDEARVYYNSLIDSSNTCPATTYNANHVCQSIYDRGHILNVALLCLYVDTLTIADCCYESLCYNNQLIKKS